MSPLISFEADDERCASERTSLATTANPPALLARAGGFDGRVEREDVGLERDAFDHADDIGNFVRARLDAVHRIDDLRDDAAAALRDLYRLRGDLLLPCRHLRPESSSRS